MELVIIAAMSRNGVIGVEGRIPWHITEDLKRFKGLTTGHPVIMGRKTYETLSKPLPGRLNIVLSHHPLDVPEVYVTSSLAGVLSNLEHRLPHREGIDYSEVFVIGGESVYREALPLAQRLELTHIHKDLVGDTYFPALDYSRWIRTADEEKEGYTFATYVKKP